MNVPQVLAGRYAIEREIGRGGMAVVYLGRDLRHVRDVAVKIFRMEGAEPDEGSHRFLQEIQIAARLSHPNILPLHDSGEADGLLYYVMPFVPGETLRQRLEREGALPVGDALLIASEIAGALAYAHSHGVIHRDIKPENILFIAGHAVVADFGIARAISAGGWDEWRLAGPAGTPTYMSPEQARGGSRVDGRSDIYSLGCVLYEMLTGEPPFRGSTPEEVVVQHLEAEPLPVQTRRPALTPELQAVVGNALAKHPADRYQTAQQMADAVGRLRTGLGPDTTGGSLRAGPAAQPRLSARTAWVSRWAAPLFAAGGIALALFWSMAAGRGGQLDSGLVYVGPFVHREGVPVALGADQCSRLVRSAAARWRDIRLTDPIFTTDQLAQLGRPPRLEDLFTVARQAHAGRLVAGEVWTWRDSVKVRGAVYDVARGPTPLREAAVVIQGDLADAEQRFAELADSLLLPPPSEPAAAGGVFGTQVLAAWQAYDSAHAALARWDLPAAEQGFREAVARDPQYGLAHLWLAQTMNWNGDPVDAWREQALAGLDGHPPLAAQDRLWGQALVALGEGRYQDACDQYQAMIRRDTLDFQGWYGRGECRRMDHTVVRDPSARSGWRFRSSYQAAISDYQHALRLIPSVHQAYRGSAFERLAGLFFAEAVAVRTGRSLEPDTVSVVGEPSVSGDSLVFTAYTFAQARDPRQAAPITGRLAAIERNRRALLQVTASWVAAFPASSAAREAHARALELVGELSSQSETDSALREYQEARRLAGDPVDATRLAASEVRVLVKLQHFDGAKRLADSILAPGSGEAGASDGVLAGLAALTGRPTLAAALLRRTAVDQEFWAPDGRVLAVPRALRENASALEAFTALQAPADSITATVRQIYRQIGTLLPRVDRDAAARAMLGRPLALAGPEFVLPGQGRALSGADYLLDLQVAWLQKDTAAVREGLQRISQLRAGARPGDIAIEVSLQEASLQLAIGDTLGATRRLDEVLDALPTLGSDLVGRVQEAGALVRMMALRAELAARAGRRDIARRWAEPVVTLWASAEPSLRRHADDLSRLTQAN